MDVAQMPLRQSALLEHCPPTVCEGCHVQPLAPSQAQNSRSRPLFIELQGSGATSYLEQVVPVINSQLFGAWLTSPGHAAYGEVTLE